MTTRSTTARPGGAGRSLRRWAPLAAVAAVVAIVVAIAAGNGGGVKKATDSASSPGPLTFEQAKAQGKQVDFGPGCDPATGRVKIPTLYAAPCVAPAKSDNGGSTAPGVTADTIKVAVYQVKRDVVGASIIDSAGGLDSPEAVADTYRAFTEFFRRHYETYGRKVELVFVQGTGSGTDEAAAKADAIRVATEVKAFAALGGPTQTNAYADELAARHVLCLGSCSGPVTDSFLRSRAPYVWPADAGIEGTRVGVEYLAKRVAGRKAIFAGDAAMHGRTRSIALVNYDTPTGDFKESVRFFQGELAKRGVHLSAKVDYFLDTAKLQENARTIISKLKAANATTIIFAGDPLTPIDLTKEATSQGYFPEWIVSGTVLTDTNFFARQYDPKQWSHAFGIVPGPVRIPQEQFDGWALHQWEFGRPPAARASAVLIEAATLQLFTGIHLAGPRLSAATFRDGLFRYPPTGGGPTQPRISWGHHVPGTNADLGLIDDETEIWFDAKVQGRDEVGRQGVGMYRWSRGGKRYLLGEQPDTPTDAFDPNGAVTGFDQRPPEDRAPDYPPPPR
jgi:hypothetical protein